MAIVISILIGFGFLLFGLCLFLLLGNSGEITRYQVWMMICALCMMTNMVAIALTLATRLQ